MRILTVIEGQAKAEAFVSYLLTLQISTHVEPVPGKDEWEVWIREEDRLTEARNELNHFQQNPNDPKYRDSIQRAQQIVRDQKKKATEAKEKIKSGTRAFRPSPMSGGIPPITLTLLIIATIVSLMTEFMDPSEQNRMGKTMMEQLSFVRTSDFQVDRDPAASLKKGQVWRAITPMFLHGFTFHLLFNAFALVQLGRILERIEGPTRYSILVLATAIGSALLQGLMPERLLGYPFFGGLSGVVFGLFGYLWVRTSIDPTVGFTLPPISVAIMMAFLLIGFYTAIAGNSRIANMAHLGGLIVGAIMAVAFVQLRLKRK